MNEANIERNKQTNYTKEAQTNGKWKKERTMHANETNEKRQRYEIYVNLNDPGSVPKG